MEEILRLARSGDEAATAALWNTYSSRLTQFLRRWLGGRPCGIADAEDLTTDAFDLLFRKLREGAYQGVSTGARFWRMAKRIATRLALGLRRRERRLKRGGKVTKLAAYEDVCEVMALPLPTESDATTTDELYRFLWLEYLRQPLFWPLVNYRLACLTPKQIAKSLGVGCDAIYEKLSLMREMLAEYLNLTDAAKRLRVEHERVRRLRWSNAVWEAHQRDLIAKRGSSGSEATGS